jgi:hypothetical protein
MQALISPEQNNFVVQVEPDDQTFEIGLPLYWIDCPSNIVAYQYQYINGQYVAYIPPVSTANENKKIASGLLSATDWTTIADVASPTNSPYLANQADFIAYRNTVRQYAVYPVAGNIVWPTAPVEEWK